MSLKQAADQLLGSAVSAGHVAGVVAMAASDRGVIVRDQARGVYQ